MMQRLGKRFFTAAVVCLILWLNAAMAQDRNPYAEDLQKFEEFVKQQMQKDKIPGLSVGFLKGDFVWTEGFGFADFENKCPAKAESMYRLASVTKPMTATGILHLVESGKIDLDAPVQNYVSYFPEKRWPVTVRHLLGHLSGISHYRNYDEEGHFKEHYDTKRSISVFKDWDLEAEPGAKFRYTSYGYNLLGAVIEGASGQSYGEYMTQTIWEPLGMNSTRMDDPVDIIPNRVRGYRLLDGKIKNSEFVDISSRFAAGGTRSNVGDLLKFAEGMMTDQVLSKETADMMWTSMSTNNGHLTGYGMGWGIGSVNGRFQVAHSGGQAETSTYLVLFPQDHLAIAWESNLEGANHNPYIQYLYHAITGDPWTIDVYTGSKFDDAIYKAMESAFRYGMAYFDRHQKPLTENSTEVEEAFAFFNGTVNSANLKSNYQQTLEKISNSPDPIAGQAAVKLGSFMTANLQKALGADHLKLYHKLGAIAFFNDYIYSYKKDGNVSPDQRFEQSFEKLVNAWSTDWSKTWNEYSRRLELSDFSDMETIGQKLKTTFSGSRVYPYFNEKLSDVIRQQTLSGAIDQAFKTAELALDLYPKSDQANVNLGVLYIFQDDEKKARMYLAKGKEIDETAMAGPVGLNRFAYALAGAGKVEEGQKLLLIARDFYPKEANLYDSIGEFYLMKGQPEQAIEWYKKALQVNPEFENAKQMLKEIEAKQASKKEGTN